MDGKKLELVFAPGCFDDFDGTQEELQELVAHLNQMIENGTFFDEAKPAPEDEAEEVMRRLEQKASRQ